MLRYFTLIINYINLLFFPNRESDSSLNLNYEMWVKKYLNYIRRFRLITSITENLYEFIIVGYYNNIINNVILTYNYFNSSIFCNINLGVRRGDFKTFEGSLLKIKTKMVKPQMGKPQMEEALKVPRFFMTLTAAWPVENPSYFYKIFFIVGLIFSFPCYALYWVEIGLNVTHIVKLSYVLCLSISVTSYIFKFISFVVRKRSFVAILNLLKSPIFYTFSDNLNYIIEDAIKFSLIHRTFVYSCLGVMFVYWIFPLIDHQKLPTAMSIDFGYFTPLIYVVQVAGMTFAILNNMSLDCLTTILMNLAAAQFSVLGGKLMSVYEDALNEISGIDEAEAEYKIIERVDDAVCEKLKQIIIHHRSTML